MLIISNYDNMVNAKKKTVIHIPKLRAAQYLFVLDIVTI